MKNSRFRVRLAAALSAVAALGATTFVAAPAHAEEIPPEYALVRDVTGSATIAKRGMHLDLPEGSKLYSKLNPDFSLQSKLITPESTVNLRIFDVPKLGDVIAKVKIQATEDSMSQLDFANGTITTTNKFKITIPHLASALLPRVNLVKKTCASGEITAELSGSADNGDLLGSPINVSGEFEIPEFRGCGISLFGLPAARDALISSMLAGGGNTLSLTLTPAEG